VSESEAMERHQRRLHLRMFLLSFLALVSVALIRDYDILMNVKITYDFIVNIVVFIININCKDKAQRSVISVMKRARSYMLHYLIMAIILHYINHDRVTLKPITTLNEIDTS